MAGLTEVRGSSGMAHLVPVTYQDPATAAGPQELVRKIRTGACRTLAGAGRIEPDHPLTALGCGAGRLRGWGSIAGQRAEQLVLDVVEVPQRVEVQVEQLELVGLDQLGQGLALQ